jgi:transposase
MDNATIHKSKTVRATLEKCGEVVLYNTQYTPEANPIEYLFAYVKHHLRKRPLGTQ